jgi:hypothetical protein
MKFCYIDENGTSNGRIAVLIGILTDHHRISQNLIIYLARGRCPAADYFYRYAPTPIR